MILALINKGVGSYGLGGTALSPSDLMLVTGNSSGGTGGITVETDPTVPSHVKTITTTNISEWNSAYGWGNHAGLYKLASYVPAWADITGKPVFTRTVDGLVPASGGSGVVRFLREDGNWAEPPSSGGSGSETDPTVPSHVKTITTGEKSNWNTAYSWGNHASVGYITQTVADGRYIRKMNQIVSASGVKDWSGLYIGTSLAYSSNSTGSTGFPSEFGATISFSWGQDAAANNGNRGRDVDLWKKNGGDELWFRGYSISSGNALSWKQFWHSGNVANPVSGTNGAATTTPTTIWVGTAAEAPAVGSRNPNTIYFLTT